MESRFSSAGFNVETVTYKNINFTAWDVGRRWQGQNCKSCLSLVNTGVLVEPLRLQEVELYVRVT